MSHALKVTVSD